MRLSSSLTNLDGEAKSIASNWIFEQAELDAAGMTLFDRLVNTREPLETFVGAVLHCLRIRSVHPFSEIFEMEPWISQLSIDMMLSSQ